MEGLPEIDVDRISAEEFLRLVAGAEPADIPAVFATLDPERALDRLFAEMAARVIPEKVARLRAEIAFDIEHDGVRHRRHLDFAAGRCQASREGSGRPRTTVDTDITSFVLMVARRTTGPRLLVRRRLRLHGDVLLGRRLESFFAVPAF
jgi:predicted lipid carrier protein YhbT